MGAFPPSFLPDWARLALFAIGAALFVWGLIGAFWHYRRGNPRKDGLPLPKPRARGIVYGPTSRGGADEDSQFHGFGDDDISIHDHGKGNRHVRPKFFRKPEERA